MEQSTLMNDDIPGCRKKCTSPGCQSIVGRGGSHGLCVRHSFIAWGVKRQRKTDTAARAAQIISRGFNYRWFSRVVMPERRGQRCRVVSWTLKTKVGGTFYGAWRGVRVEFTDGTQVEAERGMFKVAGVRGDAVDGKCRARGCKRVVGRHGVRGLCNLHACRERRRG